MHIIVFSLTFISSKNQFLLTYKAHIMGRCGNDVIRVNEIGKQRGSTLSEIKLGKETKMAGL